jgi:short-subunit dehydrogenase
VRTEVAAADLAGPDGPASLVEAAERLAFEPDILVNSAGFGVGGPFAERPLDRQLAMVRVNVVAAVALTGAFLPRMVARREGAIVNVASTAGFQPMPYLAAYAASKAFVVSFGEALWAEARASGVGVVTVCPGPVATRFEEHASAAGGATGAQEGKRYLTVDDVVRAAFEALEAGRPRAVLRVGGWGAASAVASKAALFLPRRWVLALSERLSRRVFPAG